MKLVKIGRMGSSVKQYCLDDKATYSRALIVAGIGPLSETEEIVLNGIPQFSGILGYPVNNNAIIIVQSKKVESKTIYVKIGKVGSPLHSVMLTNDFTVGHAIEISHIRLLENEEIWLHVKGELNGIIADRNTILKDGDAVIIEKISIITKIVHELEDIIEDANGDIGGVNADARARIIMDICKGK